jgi:hypothetical protein
MRNTKSHRVISASMLALLALLFSGAKTITAAPGDFDTEPLRRFENGFEQSERLTFRIACVVNPSHFLMSTGGTKDFGLLFLRDLAVHVEILKYFESVAR